MAAHAAAHAGALPERPAALPPSPATLPRASQAHRVVVRERLVGFGRRVGDAVRARRGRFAPRDADADGAIHRGARDEEDEAEKERLMREKEQIEREKTKVEEEAVARARQYQQEKKTSSANCASWS